MEFGGGASGEIVRSIDDLLRNPPHEGDAHPVLEEPLGVEPAGSRSSEGVGVVTPPTGPRGTMDIPVTAS